MLMVGASEFRMQDRKDDLKGKMEILRKQEKEQEKKRMEHLQISNYIRDTLIKGLILN